ncbi:MAG TPA: glycoside hydrolase family 2 TIM barrel-domain containing protein [Saprospiraceae bacterium]|nr:glycoside hydrolase family 2 TIM barrel-domain containing protein [Saprospiraceae bacterium]
MQSAYTLVRTSLYFLLTILSIVSFGQSREIITLQSNWKFALGENQNASRKDFDDSSWQTVSVPHDWAIGGPFNINGDGNTAKLPWKGEGWYRYKLNLPATYNGKRIVLLFDGVMSFPTVYVNGQLAGKWDYGYNSFYFDITEFIKVNTGNVIAVHADTRSHDSRWYPGAGIFRKVQVIVADPIHVDMWGTQITTPVIKSNYATVNVISTIVNQSLTSQDEIIVQQIILSPNGKEIANKESKGKIAAGSNKNFELTFTLTNPQKWEVYNGVLYSLKTIVRNGDRILDVSTTNFGIRSIRFTPDDGFYLNDQRVQLKGVCLHHDHGPLGAAFYPRAMERQLQLLKGMGCNAIRTSHNVPAPELLELCDKMGILVIDEIFDKYDQKADILPETDFQEFSERNVKNFVMRDRNHPSIFLWSVGNEIGDVQWNLNGGFDKLRTMVNNVKRYDPSRPITLVCDSRNSARLRHFDYYDVHSWNYGRRYDLARQLEPNKAVIISESASTVSTRGFYEWPLPEKKTDFTKSLQVSSYDLNAPDWAEISDDDFMWQQEENYIAGEFVWTGFDYLGEPTPYENGSVKKLGMTDAQASVSSYFGIFDLVGIPKDRYYLYKSYWNPDETTVHILPHWNWPGMEGKQIPVYVYTNGDCAELILNGMSLGTKCKVPDAQNSKERFRLMWSDVIYQPGELKAVAFREGEKIGEAFVKTVGEPLKLKLTPDRTTLGADGMDLSYIMIEALDNDGNVCPLANQSIQLKVTGEGSIAGVGNGNPQSIESFQSNHIMLFYGKAMLILRSSHQKGNIEVTATADGLIQANSSIKVE